MRSSLSFFFGRERTIACTSVDERVSTSWSGGNVLEKDSSVLRGDGAGEGADPIRDVVLVLHQNGRKVMRLPRERWLAWYLDTTDISQKKKRRMGGKNKHVMGKKAAGLGWQIHA